MFLNKPVIFPSRDLRLLATASFLDKRENAVDKVGAELPDVGGMLGVSRWLHTASRQPRDAVPVDV